MELICSNQDKWYFMQSKPQDYLTLSCDEQHLLVSRLLYMEMNTASETHKQLQYSVLVNLSEGEVAVSIFSARSFLFPINFQYIVEKQACSRASLQVKSLLIKARLFSLSQKTIT